MLASISTNIKVSSFSDAISPLSWGLFVFLVYSSSAKHPDLGAINELAFNKELNITFLLNSVIVHVTLIRALNFEITVFIIHFARL